MWVFPDNAGDKAKISLSFPDWKEGNVAPATFEVSIRKAPKNQRPKVDLLKINRSIAKELRDLGVNVERPILEKPTQ